MKIIKWYSFILGITSFSIPNICSISKNHLGKIRKNECCSAQNIVTENNNEVFASWLNPNNSIKVNHWSSIIQKNSYLNRSNIEFCSSYHVDPDMRVGGGLYANNDYYQPQYPKENGIGIFKYYDFSEIQELHTDKLDLTPDFVSNHGSISKSDTKLFFTHLLNNLLNDWYWRTFQEELSSENIPDFGNQLSLVNQDWNFWSENFNDLMQLEFGVEYNEIQKTHVPINEWVSILIGALASAVFTAACPEAGPLMSFLMSAYIGFSMSSIFTSYYSYKTVHQIHRFISKSLTMRFWNYLFSNLLGTPSHLKGVLLDFKSKYQELPSQLSLDNFDFYLPLDSFIVGFHHLDFHNASLQLSLHTTAMRAGVDLWDLKSEITKELNYDDYFEHFVTKEQKYADDWIFIYSVLYWLKRMVPQLTDDLDDYFSLSHTELFVEKTVPVTLYFNEGNKYHLGITWNRTIYIKGKA